MLQLLSNFNFRKFYVSINLNIFRTRADEVLKRATEVSDALEDAEQAQVRTFAMQITRDNN